MFYKNVNKKLLFSLASRKEGGAPQGQRKLTPPVGFADSPLKEGAETYSLLRMILPLMVLGSSVRNSTMRGYL